MSGWLNCWAKKAAKAARARSGDICPGVMGRWRRGIQQSVACGNALAAFCRTGAGDLLWVQPDWCSISKITYILSYKHTCIHTYLNQTGRRVIK